MDKLTPLKIIFQILSIGIAGVIQFFLIFFMLFVMNSWWTCGKEYFNLWYEAVYSVVYLTIIFFVEILILKRIFKELSLFQKIIFPIIIGVILYPMFYGYREALNVDKYYQDFNQNKWMKYESKDMSMVRTLVEEGTFINQSRDQILETFGPGIQDSTSKIIEYRTDGYATSIQLVFFNEHVWEVKWVCYD